MRWEVPKIWNGGDVWTLGGGASVAEQFQIPTEVINNVKSKLLPPSSYSPYMSFLHDKHVIGINVAYKIGNWMDMIFFGDCPFYLEQQQGLFEYPGLIISCASNTRNVEWIKYLETDRNHPRGITPNKRMVSWNKNSGSASISLAAHTGVKRIFLLGFDMNITNNSQHWHTIYIKDKNQLNTVKHAKDLPFERHMRGFPQIAEDAKRLGIEIINVSPNSAIKEFEKVSLKEII